MKKEYNEFILSEFCQFSCKILILLNIVNILEKAIKKGQQKIIIKKREKKTHSRQNNIHVDEWEKWGIDAPPPPPNYACMCVKYCTKYSDTWKI